MRSGRKLHARYPVLLTLKLRGGSRTLRSDDAHAAIQQALAASSERGELRVIEYSVQWNHLHLIAEATDERVLARGMISVTVRIARALNRLWKRSWLAKLPDVFSSGPWFDGWKASAVGTSADSSPRWLGRARSWLLSIGRKRHGLLDPCESPAPG